MIRPYVESDADAVLALNAANEPEVGSMDLAKLAEFADWAPYFRVVDVDGELAGYLIGLREGAPYGSPNFGWFRARYQSFAYVDRIALAAAYRGQGWGPALYADFAQWAAEDGAEVLCCEVNVEPPNPRSLRFHKLNGWQELEEFEPTNSPDYRVVMLEKVPDRS